MTGAGRDRVKKGGSVFAPLLARLPVGAVLKSVMDKDGNRWWQVSVAISQDIVKHGPPHQDKLMAIGGYLEKYGQ